MKREEPDSSLKQQAVKDAGGAEVIDYETVLRVVQGWTPAMRAALMHNILDTLAQQAEASRKKRNTLDRALGLAKVPGQPAPSDEEVERWLDERRMEKYG
ncbi:MAG TPA: hypothetical protein VEX13_16035 [Chloroflexia bacterium]|nr:hypothetical protein [Chloroflexia bacterium]